MEPEVVKRRGRKRKTKGGEDANKSAKKTVNRVRNLVLIGWYVKKEFEDSGEFLGKIVSYDTGLYRVDYEYGDFEDLETREVKGLLVVDNEMDAAFRKRKKSLDAYLVKKYAKKESVQSEVSANKDEAARKDNGDKVETVISDSGVVDNGGKLVNAEKVELDGESSSDLSDYEQSDDVVEVECPLVPLP